ncbi:hypothetical protein EDD85DRAFT_955310 [Armillaria nabsnona]|nr:hypothetical protein EDD85DRAFT_955310 [Armillaria nabsnona]
MTEVRLDELPNIHLLKLTHPHPEHVLHMGSLLHNDALDNNGSSHVCNDCSRHLGSGQMPPLALANNMWIGKVPFELSILSLAEHILITRHLLCTYLVKLYPKAEHAEHWLESDAVYLGLKGNISTHPLNTGYIAGLVSANVLPPQARVLSAVIGIIFVSPRGVKMRELPGIFHVRREHVRKALLWLKENNPLYHDIIISDDNLSDLPSDGVPNEILSTVRTLHDIVGLAMEQDTYIPNQDGWDSVAYEPGTIRVEGGEMRPDPFTVPDVLLLHSNGMIDTNGDNITDTDIMAHALANLGNEETVAKLRPEDKYFIRRGSMFTNEYARINQESGE